MEYRYFFKEKDGEIIPVISVRSNSDNDYVDIEKHQIKTITSMFSLWDKWWNSPSGLKMREEK